MEFRQIETLLTVIELESFSRAAARLGYSQSAVTMQIKQLEAELGVRLLDRLPRGARPTEEGRTFAFHAREILAAASRAVASVQQGRHAADGLVGTLRLGSVESIATAMLPGLIARYHEAYPDVELVVSTARVDELARAALDNRIDLVFTMDRKLSLEGLSRTVLGSEDIVFAAAPSLAGRIGTVRLDALASMPLVLTERGESYRYELECLLAERDERLHPIVETGNTETLVHLAVQGVGVAFLPRFSVASALSAGTLAELPCDFGPLRMWNQLFVHAAKPVTSAMEVFMKMLREHVPCTPGAPACGSVDGDEQVRYTAMTEACASR